MLGSLCRDRSKLGYVDTIYLIDGRVACSGSRIKSQRALSFGSRTQPFQAFIPPKLRASGSSPERLPH